MHTNAKMKLQKELQEEVSLIQRSRISLLAAQSCRPGGVKVMRDGQANNL